MKYKLLLITLLLFLILLNPYSTSHPVNATETVGITFSYLCYNSPCDSTSLCPHEEIQDILSPYGFDNCSLLMKIEEDFYIRYLFSASYTGILSSNTLNQLDQLPFIEDACLDTGMSLEDITDFNDVLLNNQWHLDNINTFETYDSMNSNFEPGDDMVIAVIDTGIDLTHEDLKDNLWINMAEYNGIKNRDDDPITGKPSYVDDIYGIDLIHAYTNEPTDDSSGSHGTHVAGIIAAAANNAKGGMGIAYKARIMAIKAANSKGEISDANAIAGINYAVSHGADVINMSFGGSSNSINNNLKYAIDEASKTCFIVAAAGNSSKSTTSSPYADTKKEDCYPACFDSVLGVMATESNNVLSSFSNWDYKFGDGSDYEIAAPGSSIYSTIRTPAGKYGKLSGTSMSTPMVAASGALVKQYLSGLSSREVTPALIKSQLIQGTKETATHTDNGSTFHYPKLNLYDSIHALPVPKLMMSSAIVYNNLGVAITEASKLVVGESYSIKLTLKNVWAKAENIEFTLLCGNESMASSLAIVNRGSIKDTLDTYEELVIGGANESALTFTVKEKLPVNTPLSFKIKLSCSNGFIAEDRNTYDFSEEWTINSTREEEALIPRPIQSINTGLPATSGTSSDMTLSMPDAPVISSYSKNFVKLAFSKITGASYYRIYRSTSKSGIYKPIATIRAGKLAYKDTNIKKNTLYYYKIKAFSDIGRTPLSKSTCWGVLSKAAKVKMNKLANGGHKITWKKRKKASAYIIYYKKTKDTKYYKLAVVNKNYYITKKKVSDIKIIGFVL